MGWLYYGSTGDKTLYFTMKAPGTGSQDVSVDKVYISVNHLPSTHINSIWGSSENGEVSVGEKVQGRCFPGDLIYQAQ